MAGEATGQHARVAIGPRGRGHWSAESIREHLLLYAVTDRAWLRGRTLPDCVREAIAGGTSFVQLREKHPGHDGHDEMLALAREILPICRAAGVPFLIDDDVALAAKVGADGVHVGQEDMACSEARRILGPDAIVGVSAQTVPRPARPSGRAPTTSAWGRSIPQPPSPMPLTSPTTSSRASARP